MLVYALCMHLRISHGLYQEQREKLDTIPFDQRIEYEELAAHIEYDCGVSGGHAERHAYCMIQWKYQWNPPKVPYKSPFYLSDVGYVCIRED